jgi:exonuclease SbcC
MITDVTIRGFQSHINSAFRLSSGLTVITGPTDSGKTAIIRAIRWVAFNEPAGDGFVNEAVGEAEVVINHDNGMIITKRRKKGGRTVYKLNDQTFEQADVPPEITAALGMARQTFGDFEAALNFAFQLEAPFLISEPPSAGAKVLGVIAGTEIVDLAIKATSRNTHAAREIGRAHV